MPYALCPMPYARRVPHVTDKGYICYILPGISWEYKSVCSDSNSQYFGYASVQFSNSQLPITPYFRLFDCLSHRHI